MRIHTHTILLRKERKEVNSWEEEIYEEEEWRDKYTKEGRALVVLWFGGEMRNKFVLGEKFAGNIFSPRS
jgi:hypothetical protein